LKTVWIVRYGEIGTKSEGIRKMFIERLIKNIEEALRTENIMYKGVKNLWSRVLVESTDENVGSILSRVFGIKSISMAYEIKASIENMKKAALKVFKRIHPRSFKIDARRITKEFPLTSLEINRIVGEHIVKETGAKVDLKSPELTIGIEVLGEKAYIYTDRIPGPGGLPLGVEGRVLALVEDESDLVAAWLMMKRGCEIVPVTTRSIDVISPLRRFMYGNKFDIMLVERLDKKKISKLVNDFKCLGICFGGRGKDFLPMIKDLGDMGVPVYTPDAFLPDDMYLEVLKRIISID